ncbi:Hint domain-containing protein [Paracoccus sp. MBLB3053]|uniref:Hint domain-containing protein n=1 Tax=Paracoccus aurantius TaxID=3073814 RepID=A0ABU2HU95_9RHOB|nr:Hint domain-containing protein [Paracoccus sp. MBLB3053]MDS9468626.1 Hint domain-containing protein [Paracoccus sp. MBLB3053]
MPASYDIGSASLYQVDNSTDPATYTLIEGDTSGVQGSVIAESPLVYDTTLTTTDGGSLDNSDFEVGENASSPAGLAGIYQGVTTIDGNDYLIFTNTSGNGTVYVVSASSDTSSYPGDFTADDINTDPYPECFAAGTLIATPTGEVKVEDLTIGDLVKTAEGRSVEVKWIGRQTLSKVFTPAERFVPVRVKAGALGKGVPHSDLVLTAEHALVIGDLAINAGALVNGSSIVFEPFGALPERVTYYHVETELHDVILANGAAAETFVDYVGRRAFDNYHEYEAIYGQERVISEMQLPRISARRLVPAAIREGLASPSEIGDQIAV